MFTSAAGDDVTNDENKWKGVFIPALSKVLAQVHPTLTAKPGTLEHVESLIIQLLGTLVARPGPHSVADVKERVMTTFPNPIDKWATGDAQAAIEKGKKKISLVLPVERVHQYLQKELSHKVDYQVSIYIVAVLEYTAADIFKLVGNYVKNIRHIEMTCQDIKVAMCADKVLTDLFYQSQDVSLSMDESNALDLKTAESYDEVVKKLINEEKQYLRELYLIIKVFRGQIAVLLNSHSKELEYIFSNVLEVCELTENLVGSLEDALEMSEENHSLGVGVCFEELAEAAEFDVYGTYARDVLKDKCRDTLWYLLQQSDVRDALQSSGHGFREAVKYVLPKLLLSPLQHAFLYFDYIKALYRLSTDNEDRECLEQVEGLLKPLQVNLEKIALPIKRKQGEVPIYSQSRAARQAAHQKLQDLQKMVDGWEEKDIGLTSCNEFICEGELYKVGKVVSGRRPTETERYAFLFDGLMILCKQSNKRTSVAGLVPSPPAEYRLKEKFFIRKIEIIDRDDQEDIKNAFEIAPRMQPRVVLFTRTPEEKNNWMAALMKLNTGSMLDRTLDSILLDNDKKHPLELPPVSEYRFSEEDSVHNIMLEEGSNDGVPIVKGGTLLKLVERLTYHKYADPMFIRTFLTTYRSFCSPSMLFSHLLERFEIPDLPSHLSRETLKRFRIEYVQCVQFRVLNVIRHWIDHHFYDFERDPELLDKLVLFLDSIKGKKKMRKWIDSIHKTIKKKVECDDEERAVTFHTTPPPIEWHIRCTEDEFSLLTLHPLELARQLTLLDFEYFCAVKPSELVGSVWTKKDKHKTSPNLLRMIHHTTNVTRWYEKSILEFYNLEERIAVMSRIIEVMQVLQELNNFNGVRGVVSAMQSAAVHRLTCTKDMLSPRLQKVLEEAIELNDPHFKKYTDKLRSVNPPCVPFLGMYLTNILHIEEGNPDMLLDGKIINFSKRRRVAEITGEIQQFQNQRYCFTTEPTVRHFLETLQPFKDFDENEIGNDLFQKSLEIQPRNFKELPKFPRKWPKTNLKSPGIKPRKMNAPMSLPLGERLFGYSSQKIQSGEQSPGAISQPGSSIFSSSQRIPEDQESDEGSVTPSTPLSPASNSDNSIFAPVVVGQGSGVVPPPLPPRPNRLPPRVKQAPDAPVLPPRSTSPPPLPPRSTTLPRRNSGLHNGISEDRTTPRSASSGMFVYPPPTCRHYSGDRHYPGTSDR